MPRKARYSFVCTNGCGECEVRVVAFESAREETLDGRLVSQELEPDVVSSCCGSNVGVYDNVRDAWVDGKVTFVPDSF